MRLLGFYYREYRKALLISLVLKFSILIIVGVAVLKNTTWVIVILYGVGFLMYSFFEGNVIQRQTKWAKMLAEREREVSHVPISTGTHKRKFALEDESEQTVERRE
jgi:hypothetical protein